MSAITIKQSSNGMRKIQKFKGEKQMKIMLDKNRNIKLPTRAHEDDAGLDIYSPDMLIIKPHKSVKVNTGIHIEIPKGYVGFLKSKSGLNVKRNLIGEGVIDSGYTGSIVVKLYNLGEDTVLINAGEKIIQLVLLPIITPELEVVDELEATERGTGGFGSTGR